MSYVHIMDKYKYDINYTRFSIVREKIFQKKIVFIGAL